MPLPGLTAQSLSRKWVVRSFSVVCSMRAVFPRSRTCKAAGYHTFSGSPARPQNQLGAQNTLSHQKVKPWRVGVKLTHMDKGRDSNRTHGYKLLPGWRTGFHKRSRNPVMQRISRIPALLLRSIRIYQTPQWGQPPLSSSWRFFPSSLPLPYSLTMSAICLRRSSTLRKRVPSG